MTTTETALRIVTAADEKPLAVQQAEAFERIAALLRANPELDLPGLNVRLHLFAPRAGLLNRFAELIASHADAWRWDGGAIVAVEADFGPLQFALQADRADVEGATAP